MNHLNCDQLLRCVDLYEYNNKFYVFMDYMDGGMISRVIKRRFGLLGEDFCKWSLYQVALGLKAMHDENILHRDIKADNVLCSASGSIKLADLGFSCFLSELNMYRSSGKGTPCFAAPELFKGIMYSKEVDVWAFGCFAYELAMGDPPFINELRRD